MHSIENEISFPIVTKLFICLSTVHKRTRIPANHSNGNTPRTKRVFCEPKNLFSLVTFCLYVTWLWAFYMLCIRCLIVFMLVSLPSLNYLVNFCSSTISFYASVECVAICFYLSIQRTRHWESWMVIMQWLQAHTNMRSVRFFIAILTDFPLTIFICTHLMQVFHSTFLLVNMKTSWVFILCARMKLAAFETTRAVFPYYVPGTLLTYFSGEYVSSLRQSPEDPMLNLLIGVTFVHLASQKFALKRHALVTQVTCHSHSWKLIALWKLCFITVQLSSVGIIYSYKASVRCSCCRQHIRLTVLMNFLVVADEVNRLQAVSNQSAPPWRFITSYT